MSFNFQPLYEYTFTVPDLSHLPATGLYGIRWTGGASGVFHRKFVDELQWLNATQYGQLVALAQLLPGQVAVR